MGERVEEEVFNASTSDGAKLALRRLRGRGAASHPVLLSHGTFSNGRVCLKLANFLREQGFDCWVLDWRGHGLSDKAAAGVSYEELALRDVEAALQCVQEQTGEESLFWVGHSAGGILPLIYLAHHPEQGARFRGIVTLASQTTDAGRHLGAKLKLGLGYVAVNALRKAPAAVFRLGPEDESLRLMNQWFRWNLSGDWVGAGGFDYFKELGRVRAPALCLAGAGDTFIAPVRGCRRVFEALGSTDKTFLYCGRAEGFQQDYSHGSIIAGSAAREDVWPRVSRWLEERSAPGARSAPEVRSDVA
ncbi:MAG TPA: alpha/beta hydrolase [Myxococcaceae bacterium]|nr:alpha/beta hydrolase [Myxococcaceae bacterium]